MRAHIVWPLGKDELLETDEAIPVPLSVNDVEHALEALGGGYTRLRRDDYGRKEKENKHVEVGAATQVMSCGVCSKPNHFAQDDVYE